MDGLFIIGGFLLIIIIITVIVFLRMAAAKKKETPHQITIIPQTAFDPNKVVSTNTTTGDTGTTTTTTKDVNGNTQTTVTTKDGASTATVTDSSGKQTATASTASTLADLVKNPTLWETVGIAVGADLLLKHPKIITKVARASAKAIANTATKLIAKVAAKDTARITERVGMKVINHAAERAAVKAATKLGTQAAVAAETGPAAPFVEAAELGFNMLTGYMDEFNLGGFDNLTNMKTLNDMRDSINDQVKKAYADNGVEWPVIYGPFDTVSDQTALQAEINANQATIYAAKLKAIQDGWKNGTIPRLPATATSDDYVTYFDANINIDDTFTDAERQKCTAMNGVYKKHPTSSNMYCTWETAVTGKCLAPWPLKTDDTYYELNKTDKMCEAKPGAMRDKCESLGQGCSYNFDTGSCNLTDAYCRRYGADNGLRNGDCSISKGEEIAETIFGRTFVRSLVNIFDPHNYAPCPQGSKTIEPYLCEENKCKATQDKINGICYDKCDEKNGFNRTSDSFGNQVNGMCYKCPDGYNKSSAGMCHKDSCDAGTERGSGVGIGFCYPKCPPGRSSDGATMCLKDCPSGYDTLSLTCQRNPVTVTDSGTVATCPPGMTTTVAGPGGMCQPGCPAGQKLYGGVCYDNNVDTNLLIKVPSSSCPNGGTNIGAICSKPVHCDGGWDTQQWGCCWIDCTETRSWNALKNCHPDQSYGSTLSCPNGYYLNGLSCYARSYGVAPVVKSLLEVGVCPADRDKVGGMCYKRCSDASWGAGPGFSRSAAGSCLKPADTIGRDPQTRGAGKPSVSDVPATTQGPQAPRGISLRTYPRPRNTPFPSTSESDFKNSTLGSHIQEGINSIRNGDATGFGKAMAAAYIVGNPAVVGLGVGDLANTGVQSAGLSPAPQ
jgi:hypothetical protein